MNYFVVFQNQTYKSERVGQYLWAPQRTKAGNEIFHWSNMKKVEKGDIIFSMYKQHIVSVNTAGDKAYQAENPFQAFENPWEKEGWLLKAKYNELRTPLSIKENIDEILKMCPSKYSPFNSKGRGNQGYLYEISRDLGEYLIGAIAKKNSDSYYPFS